MAQEKLQHFIESTQLDHASPTNATANIYLTVYQTLVECDSTDGAFTVYLPPVSECAGKIFSIKHVTYAGAVTVADLDDSMYWDGDYTLAAAEDGALMYSDGKSWWKLAALD